MEQQEIMNLLQDEKTVATISYLSKITGVPKEEAERQIDLYQTIEKHELELSKSGLDASTMTKQRWQVINELTKYSEMEQLPVELLQSMNQKTIISLLQGEKTPESILHLSELTGLSIEEIESQIDLYQTIEKHELELTKSGLDTSTLTSQRWTIINSLTQSTMPKVNTQTR